MNVFLVEDDQSLRTVWEHALEDAGHTVESAASQHDAMRTLLTGSFDLIVLDVVVRNGNGLNLVDYISYAHPQTPVMVVTGTGFFPNGELSELMPKIDWFMRKPVPVADFMASVDHARARTERCSGEALADPDFVSDQRYVV